jgi:hypothetical protein
MAKKKNRKEKDGKRSEGHTITKSPTPTERMNNKEYEAELFKL